MISVKLSQRIRDLNDALRTSGSSAAGQWMITDGVQAEGPDFVALALDAVRRFDGFDRHNDPYAEHDFGSLNIAGQSLLWKIDYYDRALRYGSDDPSDPAVTRRVLTVMLASEY